MSRTRKRSDPGRVYDRSARFYDLLDAPIDRMGGADRLQRVLSGAKGRGLEVDASFDTVAATCVFCSVADPIQGLRGVGRVVKPGGRVLLLEHVRPRNPFLGKLFDLLSPLTRRLVGPEIGGRRKDHPPPTSPRQGVPT